MSHPDAGGAVRPSFASRAPALLLGDPTHPDVTAHFRRLADGEDPNAIEPLPRTLRDGCGVAVCTRGRPDLLDRLLRSLVAQRCPIAQLVVVDASAGDATERVVRDCPGLVGAVQRVDYFRVRGALAGLTRQRNVALRWMSTRLVAFFDDDVVLQPGCLAGLMAVHAVFGDTLVGAGPLVANEVAPPSRLWRARRALRIVSPLRGGAYARSGMSIPWGLDAPATLADGDWLVGCAAMWRTEDARAVGFAERLQGYGSAEDLEFSLRMRAHGRIVLTSDARVLHLHATSGRPDQGRMAYEGARNLYFIHRTCLPGRRWLDEAYFHYAFTLDTILRALALLTARPVGDRGRFVLGRLRFYRDLLRHGAAGVEPS